MTLSADGLTLTSFAFTFPANHLQQRRRSPFLFIYFLSFISVHRRINLDRSTLWVAKLLDQKFATCSVRRFCLFLLKIFILSVLRILTAFICHSFRDNGLDTSSTPLLPLSLLSFFHTPYQHGLIEIVSRDSRVLIFVLATLSILWRAHCLPRMPIDPLHPVFI